MNDDFNTGWDPYSALIMCEQNIQQCAMAINQGTEVMKDLANKYNHQQEVIQQLMFQNRKLQQMINTMNHKLILQDTTLNLLQAQQAKQGQ